MNISFIKLAAATARHRKRDHRQDEWCCRVKHKCTPGQEPTITQYFDFPVGHFLNRGDGVCARVCSEPQ